MAVTIKCRLIAKSFTDGIQQQHFYHAASSIKNGLCAALGRRAIPARVILSPVNQDIFSRTGKPEIDPGFPILGKMDATYIEFTGYIPHKRTDCLTRTYDPIKSTK